MYQQSYETHWTAPIEYTLKLKWLDIRACSICLKTNISKSMGTDEQPGRSETRNGQPIRHVRRGKDKGTRREIWLLPNDHRCRWRTSNRHRINPPRRYFKQNHSFPQRESKITARHRRHDQQHPVRILVPKHHESTREAQNYSKEA